MREVLLENQNDWGPCRRRTGEAPPRAEKFGDLITADHTVLSDNCVTHYLHRYGKDNSKKLYENLGGRKYRIGNVYLLIENKDYSYRYTWMTSKLLERSGLWLPCGK